MVGPEARAALRGQRNHCYKNNKYFSKQEMEKNIF